MLFACRVLVGVCLVTALAASEAAGETPEARDAVADESAAIEDATTATGDAATEEREASDTERDAAELAARLGSPEVAERYAAVTAIAALGDPAWIEPLARVARDDPSANIRGWALRALREIGTAEALLQIQAIQRRDPDRRIVALAAQLLAGTPLAAPPITGAPAAQTGGVPGAGMLGAASLETLQLRLDSARRARRITAAGFTLAATGFTLLMIGVPVTFLGGSDDAMAAGITLQALGSLMWLIDTPLLWSASRRMEAITGRSHNLRKATAGLYVAGLLLTVLHLGTGFVSEEMAIAMPIVNGIVCTTARIMSLILGSRASREARAYLESHGGGVPSATAR